MNILVISTQFTHHLVPLCDVIFCKQENENTTFHLVNNEIIETDEVLAVFEQRLNTNQFYKPNDYMLINLDFIDRVLFKNPYIIVLKNNKIVSVDANNSDLLFQILENL